jgi:hypothetical protein
MLAMIFSTLARAIFDGAKAKSVMAITHSSDERRRYQENNTWIRWASLDRENPFRETVRRGPDKRIRACYELALYLAQPVRGAELPQS